MANFSWPTISVSASSGPLQFTKNGGTVTVTQDTTTPANDIPLPVRIQQLYFPSSSGNNSTAQLASGATFTGTIESILDLQAAQIEVTCDQPYTLTIKQYIDAAGLFQTSTDTITRAAGVPYNENVTLPGNYFRLTVQNTGASTTTTLNINTTFGMMATGPRTVTALGNNRSAINEVNGAALSLGQTTASASVPVVLANEDVLDQFITGQGAQSAAGNNIVLATAGTGSTDCQQYRSIALQINGSAGIASGAVTFEGSNDNFASGNGVPVPLYDKAAPNSNPVTSVTVAASSQRFFEGPIGFRYFRARISTVFSGGTVQAFTTLRMTSYQPSAYTVQQGTAAQLAVNANITGGSLAANQSSNIAQINAVTPLMGNGVTGTGSLRVTLASDTTSNTNPFLFNMGQFGGTTVVTGGVAGLQGVGGNVASAAADSGNPVKVGGVYRTSFSTLTTGQRGDLLLDVNGRMWPASPAGRSVVTTVRNAYATTSVTTGAWVQLVASTGAAIHEISIDDTSGQTLELGTGAAASEVRLVIIPQGGTGRIPVSIAASTRLSIRAVSATASVGEININAYGV